jgi:hypothetical protein
MGNAEALGLVIFSSQEFYMESAGAMTLSNGLDL